MMTVLIRDVTGPVVNSRTGRKGTSNWINRSKRKRVELTIEVGLVKFTRMLKREIVKRMLEVGQVVEESQQ